MATTPPGSVFLGVAGSEKSFPEFDLATYREIKGEPGRFELEWLS